jgi:hypothetical protein
MTAAHVPEAKGRLSQLGTFRRQIPAGSAQVPVAREAVHTQ